MIRILDGSMGRELLRMGAPFKQPGWSALALIEAPEYVRATHDAFVRAGADVVTTNSYAVVPFHIGEEPSEAGSTSTIAPISRWRVCRMILIIRSLPMFPVPMIAAFTFSLMFFILICKPNQFLSSDATYMKQSAAA
jgi:hypothetical protein